MVIFAPLSRIPTWPATLSYPAGAQAAFGTIGELAADCEWWWPGESPPTGPLTDLLAQQPEYATQPFAYTGTANRPTGANPLVCGLYNDEAHTDPVYEASIPWTMTGVP